MTIKAFAFTEGNCGRVVTLVRRSATQRRMSRRFGGSTAQEKRKLPAAAFHDPMILFRHGGDKEIYGMRTNGQDFEELETSTIYFDPARVVRGIVFHVMEEMKWAKIDLDSVQATLRRLESAGLTLEAPRSKWAALSDAERLGCLLAASDTVLCFEEGRAERVTLKSNRCFSVKGLQVAP